MIRIIFLAAAVVFIPLPAFAAHPLISDDTGTQGRGKVQLEITGQYEHEGRDGVTTTAFVVPTIPAISYGISDSADLILGISYVRVKTAEGEHESTEAGISDASVELKWRFFENDGLSFALKPGLTLPTGDADEGLGAGKITSRLFLIATNEAKPWTFDLNLGYIRNENRLEERRDLWHASLAAEVEVSKRLKTVANIGIERDPDRTSNMHPAFILGGLIYSVSERLDIDVGLRKVINTHGNGYSIPMGITWRF